MAWVLCSAVPGHHSHNGKELISNDNGEKARLEHGNYYSLNPEFRRHAGFL